MRYLDEYRDARLARALAAQIARRATRPWTLMEICGGQTHTLMRYGIDELLPESVRFLHGPGCPVCVTPPAMIDKAIALAGRPDVIVTSFGDMLRVPGSHRDLLGARALGGDVRVVYSPVDAVQLARENPEKSAVFFAIGFETTAPANAAAVRRARDEGVRNFFLLVSQLLVPPAMRLLLAAPDNQVEGLIAPGHVCTVMGAVEYEALARDFRIPIVIAGFEPVDLLQATAMLVAQLERGTHELQNQYVRTVARVGNQEAQRMIAEVFEVCDREWRALGPIAASGLRLRPEYAAHDAESHFELAVEPAPEPLGCISAEVLRGVKEPTECPSFATTCTPLTPLGAGMVSSEGACAAYYRYRRRAGSAR